MDRYQLAIEGDLFIRQLVQLAQQLLLVATRHLALHPLLRLQLANRIHYRQPEFLLNLAPLLLRQQIH